MDCLGVTILEDKLDLLDSFYSYSSYNLRFIKLYLSSNYYYLRFSYSYFFLKESI